MGKTGVLVRMWMGVNRGSGERGIISRAVCVRSASAAHIRTADLVLSRAGNPDSGLSEDAIEPPLQLTSSFVLFFSVLPHYCSGVW